jgi:hypothetical protein
MHIWSTWSNSRWSRMNEWNYSTVYRYLYYTSSSSLISWSTWSPRLLPYLPHNCCSSTYLVISSINAQLGTIATSRSVGLISNRSRQTSKNHEQSSPQLCLVNLTTSSNRRIALSLSRGSFRLNRNFLALCCNTTTPRFTFLPWVLSPSIWCPVSPFPWFSISK